MQNKWYWIPWRTVFIQSWKTLLALVQPKRHLIEFELTHAPDENIFLSIIHGNFQIQLISIGPPPKMLSMFGKRYWFSARYAVEGHKISESHLSLILWRWDWPKVVGWVGLWGFLLAPSAKRKDHHGVSSGWSSTWFHSNTGLSSTQYEQIPIIFGVWPFCLTPFFSVYNILAGLWLNCISSVEITLFLLSDILLQHRALFQC